MKDQEGEEVTVSTNLPKVTYIMGPNIVDPSSLHSSKPI